MSSIFSGKNGRNAAMWTAGYVGGQSDRAQDLIQAGQGAANNALGQARGLYQGAQGQATRVANQGYNQARRDLTGATAAWQPYGQAGAGAVTAYGNAMGLNGADAAAQARSNFANNPGYQFARDQALDSIQRTAAARGGLAGGNTSVDMMKYATGFADQTYNQYLNNLQPLMQGGMQAAGATQQNARDMAGLASGRAQMLTDAINRSTAGQAGTLGAQGDLAMNAAGNRANILMNATGQIAQAGQEGYAAGDKAAANRFGAMMGGVNMAGQLLGAGMGMPGGLGGLFRRFGGNNAAAAHEGDHLGS